MDKKLIHLLWGEYVDLIMRGVPVYFTFTKDSLEDLLNRNNIEFDDACQLINSIVREYIDIHGEHVVLKRSALVANETGFSAAILLVCQQVLAVEEMVNTYAHSENAYFPHLRDFISDELESASVNPFNYSEFESIWRTLSSEIYSVNQDKRCVTFSFEEVKGANKAKRFPLSQALFTKEDVVRIIDAIGQSNLKTNSEEAIIFLVRSNRSVLSRRGKRLITYPWMKHALIKQIKGLSKSIGELNQLREVITNRKREVSELHIKVHLDNSDWLNTEYVINVFDKNDDLIDDTEAISKYFSTIIGGNICTVLVPHPDGDCWILDDSKYIPNTGDELIVLHEKMSSSAISSLLASYFGFSEDAILSGEFSRSKKCSYFRCVVKFNLNDSISIHNGKICKSSEGVYSREIEFNGGITVNRAGDRYSCLYLPDSVVIAGKTYQLIGKIKINKSLHTFEHFRETIKHLANDEEYKFELEDGVEFKIKVAPRFREPVALIEFSNFKGRLMPISRLRKNINSVSFPSAMNVPPHEIYKKLKNKLENSDFSSISRTLKDLQH